MNRYYIDSEKFDDTAETAVDNLITLLEKLCVIDEHQETLLQNITHEYTDVFYNIKSIKEYLGALGKGEDED